MLHLAPRFAALTCAVIALWLSAETAYAQLPCHGIESPQSPGEGFALPYKPFTQAKELLLAVECAGTTADLMIGTGSRFEYVYNRAYEYRGEGWQPIVLSPADGARAAGESGWIVGRAQASVSRTAAEMQEKNYFVAYVCTWDGPLDGGSWKCGCKDAACTDPGWQLQYFAFDPEIGGEEMYGAGDEFYMGPISTYRAHRGDTIVVRGGGFSARNNTVYIGNARTLTGVPSEGGTRISFDVPSDTPFGVHMVSVGNGEIDSEFAEPLAVVRAGARPPRITGVTPEQGLYGDEVTIHGENFAPEGNIVFSTQRVYVDVPSPDGTTITLAMRPFPDEDAFVDGVDNPDLEGAMPIYLHVMNENGKTAAPGFYELAL